MIEGPLTLKFSLPIRGTLQGSVLLEYSTEKLVFVDRTQRSHGCKDLLIIRGIVLAHSLRYTRNSKEASVPQQSKGKILGILEI